MSLWHNRDFLKLWAGDAVSDMGNQITQLALPLIAVLTLDASPAELGFLGAAQFAPVLLFGLVAGVWVDRLRRRPLMIAADLSRALCIGSVPLLAALDQLTITYLCLVAFVFGTLSLFFDIAYQSFLPSLVRRDQLVEGNSKLSATGTVAEVAGPAAGGWIVHALSAPVALVFDAVSFLASAIGLSIIKTREPVPVAASAERDLRRELVEGLSFVTRHKLLRIIAGTTATSNFFGRILFTGYTIYLVRELDLSAGVIGVTFACASVGSVIGVFLAERCARRAGLGRAIVWSILIGNAALLLIPAAGSLGLLTVPTLVIGMFIWGMANPVYNINQVSLRQAITPERLLGRMNASMRFLVWGTVPLGFLAGGALGSLLGVWPALLIGAVGGLVPAVWTLPSALMALREQPDPSEDEMDESAPSLAGAA
ncbi:MFS transporter [Streptomyces sp. NPDC051940]|uniref:MFS transporter n=1 Tax=Streptomyces sp. NPDC051940 TaxID=3155675 RepID=UPI0034454C8F